jgi:hypothetical protein
MLVTPRSSGRTIMPTTIVANHMKVAWYENAVRSGWMAHQQAFQSDR